jgi:hypothetical protein
MPVVLLHYKKDQKWESLLDDFVGKFLPDVITACLAFKEGAHGEYCVTGSSVKLQVVEGSKYDQNTEDIQITIFAHSYPERIKTGVERASAVKKSVLSFFEEKGVRVSVLVQIIFAHIEIG